MSLHKKCTTSKIVVFFYRPLNALIDSCKNRTNEALKRNILFLMIFERIDFTSVVTDNETKTNI